MQLTRKVETGAPLFEPVGFIMIRSPLLPVETIQGIMTTRAPAQIDTTDPASLQQALERDERHVRAWLADILLNPVVREAILVGSRDLYQAIPRWQQAPDSRRGRAAQINMLRYLSRMVTRPTPFGLFAGVAMGTIGPRMDIRIGPISRNRKRTRPDMQWLLYLIREVEQDLDAATHVHYFTNPAIFLSGGRLYLPYADSYGQAGNEKTVSLRVTPIVLRALTLARQGISFVALTEILLAERPSATRDQVSSLVSALCEQGALVSSLRPPLTGGDASRHVLDHIANIPGCDDVRERLRVTLAHAEAYDAQAIGKGVAAFETLRDVASIPEVKLHSTLEVDMATAIDGGVFSLSVADEVARAAEIWLRLSTSPPHLPQLEVYRREFIERYGEGREVPLLELLDADIGLGPPPNYQHPPSVTERPALSPIQHPDREHALFALAATALRERRREIELDGDVLSSLQVHNLWQDIAPDTLELYVSIAAKSQEAIASGEYAVVIGPRIGAAPAGRSFGRFCDILGAECTDALVHLARDEESAKPGRIFAELVYLPMSGHAANVMTRPILRDYEIVLATSPGVEREKTLPMEDIMVGVRDNRFHLRSASHNKEIIITNTHLLTHFLAHNICRFLTEVSIEGTQMIHTFDWGAARSLPYLPRVRAGRAVLCPAEWHMPTDLVGVEGDAVDVPGWYRRLQEWRRTWDVPQHVYFVEDDNRLLLDLENPVCVADLGDECRQWGPKGSTITIQEMLPTFEDIWTEATHGRHLVEFIVPLKKRHMPVSPEPQFVQQVPITLSDHVRPLGSDWLYTKLYLGRDRQNDFVAGPLHEFMNRVLEQRYADHWFFIRYTDPDPHLRVRFQGDPDTLLRHLLPALSAWSQTLVADGSIRKLVLDSYDREVERYGGVEGIYVAERIFAADSMCVMDLIALQAQGALDLPPAILATCTVDDLVSSLGLRMVDRLNLYRTVRQLQENPFRAEERRLQKRFHEDRKAAQHAIGDRSWLRTQPGGVDLDACLKVRAESLGPLAAQLHATAAHQKLTRSTTSSVASYIHMHCNRLFGTDRLMEYEAMYYLQRTLESLERYAPPGVSVI